VRELEIRRRNRLKQMSGWMLPLSDIAVGRSIGVADTVGRVLLILQRRGFAQCTQQNRVCPYEQHPTTTFPLLSSLLPLAGWMDGKKQNQCEV
jgi:hypothetical protein